MAMGRGLGARHIGFGTVISMSSRDKDVRVNSEK